MYGHGAAPAPPHRSASTVITLRVLFTASGVLCCGLLACVPLFRIAVLRGRTADWALAWVSIPLSIACLSVIGSLPEEDTRTDVALAVILLLGAASSAYFLTVDIRWHQQQGLYPGGPVPPSPHATTVHSAGPHTPYGYPQPASPYAPTPVPQPPHTPIPQAPASPVPPQPPQRPAPARIDQVRAELDELSDYLRRQDGQGGPGGTGGSGGPGGHNGQHGPHESGR